MLRCRTGADGKPRLGKASERQPAGGADHAAERTAKEIDRKVFRDSIRITRKIAAQRAFDKLRGPEVAPGPNATSDDDLDAFVRANANSAYHVCGTCKMGQDEMAVVAPDLRVHGIDGLRVVDASIMPALVSGNTNAPTIMIAEKASDMIREDAE